MVVRDWLGADARETRVIYINEAQKNGGYCYCAGFCGYTEIFYYAGLCANLVVIPFSAAFGRERFSSLNGPIRFPIIVNWEFRLVRSP
jgi:hypothetical protein